LTNEIKIVRKSIKSTVNKYRHNCFDKLKPETAKSTEKLKTQFPHLSCQKEHPDSLHDRLLGFFLAVRICDIQLIVRHLLKPLQIPALNKK
jgi:hypothetical protein